MNFRVLIVFVLFGSMMAARTSAAVMRNDSIIQQDTMQALDPDEMLEKIKIQKHTGKRRQKQLPAVHQAIHGFTPTPVPETKPEFVVPAYIEPVAVDSVLLQANPFFVDLILLPDSRPALPKVPTMNFGTMYFGRSAGKLEDVDYLHIKKKTPEQTIEDLRQKTRDRITSEATSLYVVHLDNLPDPESIRSKYIAGKPIRRLKLPEETAPFQLKTTRKLNLDRFVGNPWTNKAAVQLQFTQNYISGNWYQGGNSNLAVLGVLNASSIYDNHDKVQWENTAEWRLGFNSVAGDTLRTLNTSDDVLKINSKFGYKAGGNFYYSTSLDFSTPFFNSYKAVNSPSLKATFLTPVRMNLNVGLDMKYKKLLSVMLSPLSYKYIYINETDPNVINPNLFGIEKGKNHLAELGSQLKAQLSWAATKEIQVDSKFSFYTNYTKVEIDWEIVGNFTVNRFLSTRILLNPRYDNTVILSGGETAKIQFKELLSFGLSYRLWQ